VWKISGVPYFASASSRAATQNEMSIVFDNRHARTARLAQSMMPSVYQTERSFSNLASGPKTGVRGQHFGLTSLGGLTSWRIAGRGKIRASRSPPLE
jgi:hypothetical protein